MMIYPSRLVAKAMLRNVDTRLDYGNHRIVRAVGVGDDRMGYGDGPGYVVAGAKLGMGERGNLFAFPCITILDGC